ncbi:MAG: flagellar hook-length control protein FliK [Pseudobdellovibrionaceae bacterium]
MSSAALSLVPTISGAGASSGSTALSILSGDGTMEAGENSLFFSLLSLQNTGIQSSSSDAALSVSEQDFGKSGFSFDPALLVLPSGLNQLSIEDLQSFLSQHSNLLSNPDFLASLTPGTPQVAAPVDQQDLLVVTADAATALTDALGFSVSDESSLTVTKSDAAQTNPLLVASNLTPQDIENLKAALEKVAAINEDIQHGLDDDAAAALALISLVPPPAASVTAVDAADTAAIDANVQGAAYLQQSEATRTQSLLDDLALTGEASDISPAETSEKMPSSQASIFAASGDKSGTTKSLKSFEVRQLSNLLALQADQSSKEGVYQALISEGEAKGAAVSGTLDDAVASGLGSNGLFLSEAQKQMGNFDPSLTAASYAMPQTHTQSTIANPVLYNSAAGSTHPATQTVASEIKASVSKSGDEQTLSVQLDPPELGRVQIQLSYEKGEPLRLHVVAEKKETLAILERDAGVLKTTLEQAGIQADTSSMSFDLASGDQQFDQFLQNSGHNGQDNSAASFNLGSDITGFDANGTLTTEVSWGGIDASGSVRYTMLV